MFYINEIIRITYKCNWKCKFCNVIKTNNFGDKDVTSDEIIQQLFSIKNKYSRQQLGSLLLTFSGGEPLLHPEIKNYIKLAKKIGVGTVQVQTNGTMLYSNPQFIDDLIEVGLDQLFIAQHSHMKEVNMQLGSYFDIDKFVKWINYVKSHDLFKLIQIDFNIVISRINLSFIRDYIDFLVESSLFDLIREDKNGTKKLSLGFIQPNGYAWINKEDLLLNFDENDKVHIADFIRYAESKKIFLDFHFVSPPLCVLNYPEYNLEYQRLKQLETDKASGNVTEGNLESYQYLWKEKSKIPACTKCKYNKYCLGFYNHWKEFVGNEYVENIVDEFIS